MKSNIKSKKHIYFLLPTVALVWGLIIYKVINGASSDTPVYQQVNKVTASATIAVATDEVYTLSLNYDDPFGKVSKPRTKKAEPTKAPRVKKKMVKAEAPEIDFSKYKYQGMVQNAGSKQKIALVLINNEMKMLKRGDLIDEYKITAIKKEAIEVRLNGKKAYLNASK